jgi:hypothetical protein
MKKYIKSNKTTGKYIGGKILELLCDGDSDEYGNSEERTEVQDDYISDFSDFYIKYTPDKRDKFELFDAESFYELCDILPIKEGIDVIAYTDHIEVVAYYGNHVETVYLYPISDKTFDSFANALENSDMSESIVLEGLISQYAWGGATIEQILSSLE